MTTPVEQKRVLWRNRISLLGVAFSLAVIIGVVVVALWTSGPGPRAAVPSLAESNPDVLNMAEVYWPVREQITRESQERSGLHRKPWTIGVWNEANTNFLSFKKDGFKPVSGYAGKLFTGPLYRLKVDSGSGAPQANVELANAGPGSVEVRDEFFVEGLSAEGRAVVSVGFHPAARIEPDNKGTVIVTLQVAGSALQKVKKWRVRMAQPKSEANPKEPSRG